MLRSFSRRSRRSCIARSCECAAGIGAAATKITSSIVERACDRIERRIIRRPLENRAGTGGGGAVQLELPRLAARRSTQGKKNRKKNEIVSNKEELVELVRHRNAVN